VAPPAPRLLVDTMLGRLAHWLRAMGYDTAYPRSTDDDGLLELARLENRVLITRDGHLAARAGARGCLLRATEVQAQLDEVVATLGLAAADDQWLSRCLECNALLHRFDAAAARREVPERVAAAHDEFWRCPTCARIYWGGTHAARILARLRALRGGPAGGPS
jgi:uncharacterized protein with PIN domain